MATLYGLPDQDDVNLLTKARDNWHKDLAENGVRVQILMATSDTDAPAVTHGGYPALATVRVVPLRDRLTKGYDAEMVVSRDDWLLMHEPLKLALLDHELSHLEVAKREVKPPKGQRVKPEDRQFVTALDDLGRPKLKLRKGDWNAGDGFKDVVERHGDNAAEFENIRRAYAVAQEAKACGQI